MQTDYGTIAVLEHNDLFSTLLKRLKACLEQATQPLIGLSGGSTPKAFYQWIVSHKALDSSLAQGGYWGVSDERSVPLESEESNLGNAQRLLLNPLEVPKMQHLAFESHLEPGAAIKHFIDTWQERFPTKSAFDLCFLGMGDDAHIASIFPGSPLLKEDSQGQQSTFSSVDVPGKGWRFSLTPGGLRACNEIIVIVCGASKTKALEAVFKGPYKPEDRPAQLLKKCAPFTTWLLDPAAAGKLQF